MSEFERRTLLAGAVALAAATLAACGRGGTDASGPADEPGDDPTGGGPSPQRLRYDDHADAYGDLWLPDGVTGLVPTVVLVHGGFWRREFGLDLMDGLARSVVSAGFAAWNVEYRRVGGGGGWPETFLDVAAAVDLLADPFPGADAVAVPDPDRIVVVGHSAGGHLAAWAAGRHRLPAGAPGADPVVRPIAAASQAGVLDLVACAEQRVGGSACPDLLGGDPDDVADRYSVASPRAVVPIGVPVLAVHGGDDTIVPLAQSAGYVDAATGAGDPAELVVVDGADHFDVIEPDHPAWQVVLDRLPGLLGADAG